MKGKDSPCAAAEFEQTSKSDVRRHLWKRGSFRLEDDVAADLSVGWQLMHV